jgi:methylthioribulose-1-phosphate dehydratase
MAQSSAKILDELLALAHFCAERGWAPATSGNFSVCDGDGHILISRSGFDKRTMGMKDLVELDKEGHPARGWKGNGRPSAEAGLHAVIYRQRPEARAIAHVHTVWNTLLSGHCAEQGYVPLEGYEILKGLSGVSTHTHLERVPILENTQDYTVLSAQLRDVLEHNPGAHGVLLSRHGLYTWGQSVAEARRHLEALEFLFEVETRRLFSKEVNLPDFLP